MLKLDKYSLVGIIDLEFNTLLFLGLYIMQQVPVKLYGLFGKFRPVEYEIDEEMSQKLDKDSLVDVDNHCYEICSRSNPVLKSSSTQALLILNSMNHALAWLFLLPLQTEELLSSLPN